MHVDALAAAAVAAGFAERRFDRRIPTVVFRIELGAVFGEELHDVVPSPERGSMHQSLSLGIRGINISSGLEQKIERRDGSLLNIFGVVPAARVGIHRTHARSRNYWKKAPIVHEVDFRTVLQQQ